MSKDLHRVIGEKLANTLAGAPLVGDPIGHVHAHAHMRESLPQ